MGFAVVIFCLSLAQFTSLEFSKTGVLYSLPMMGEGEEFWVLQLAGCRGDESTSPLLVHRLLSTVIRSFQQANGADKQTLSTMIAMTECHGQD